MRIAPSRFRAAHIDGATAGEAARFERQIVVECEAEE
jgi:hypothetical protein